MTLETHTTDHPTLARPDFAGMPPLVAINDSTWHGSGFRPGDVLSEVPFFIQDDMSACGACKSLIVRYIFFRFSHNWVESDVRVELVCSTCGKFTVHRYERL